jgi:tryptophan 2,3-dioxygenase
MDQHPTFNEEELRKGTEYLERLKSKYELIGQDFFDYLEGLVQSNGLTYWDYIHLNSLLGLQTPRTNHPDEMIFVVYHQITELYFKLIKHELLQLTDPGLKEFEDPSKWMLRLKRVVNYFRHLGNSFDIMHSGMDLQQFRKFRMALLPASGFQSVQFRHIEIMSTDLSNLVHPSMKGKTGPSIEDQYPHLYWKRGGIETGTGQKTLTLKEFEKKYDQELRHWLRRYESYNLNHLFQQLDAKEEGYEDAKALLREYDTYVNIHWRLSHLASASRYLVLEEEGTGGTNWRQYLPPKFQKTIFYPPVWSEQEIDEWGKAGIMKIFREKVQTGWMKG